MTDAQLAPVLRHLRRLAAPCAEDLPNSILLERFVSRRDSTAFEALVRRHGPLVWRVCLRVLRREQDAEDAFQATFLALARRAASIRKPGSLASFLHGAAYRIARRIGRDDERRRGVERQGTLAQPADPMREAAMRELGGIIEEEVHRLPEKLRAPLLLCYWEGLTNEEAAGRLGWPCGTVKTRLAKARELLQIRLTRRGVALPAGVVALLLAPHACEAKIPAALAGKMLDLGVARTAVPTRIAALAESGLTSLTTAKWKFAALLVLAAAMTGTAGVLMYYSPSGGRKPPELPSAQGADTPRSGDRDDHPPGVDRFGDPLPPGALARIGTVRFRDGGGILNLVYSPDGKTLAEVSNSNDCGVIRLWDAASGKVRLVLKSQAHRVFSLAFSPDGKQLAAVGTWKAPPNAPVEVWDATTGKLLREFAQPIHSFAVAFAHDGRRIAVSGMTGTVRLWDLGSGKKVLELEGQSWSVWSLAFSADGKFLAAADDRTIRLWDAATGKELHRMSDAKLSWSSVAFSPDGKVVAGGSREGTVRLWDAATGRERLKIAGHDKWRHARDCNPDGPNIVAFAPDGKSLVSGHEGVVLDAATGKEICSLQGHHRWLRSLVFAPDGKTLAGEDTFRIRFWDAATGKEILKDAAHRDPVCDLAFSSDSKTVLTTSWDNSAGLWDVDTGRERFRVQGREKVEMQGNRIAVAPDGRTMAAWLGDVLYSWEPRKPNAVREHSDLGGGDCRRCLAFSPEGRILAASWKYGDKQIRLWAEGTDKKPRLLPVGKNWSNYLVFSPDGKVLASRNGDGSAALWDVASGKELRTLPGFRARKADSPKGELGPLVVNLLAFSPDSNALALGGTALPSRPDGAIGLWDRASGKELIRLTASDRWMVALAFSPDGKTLAAGHDSGTVRFWETASGKIRREWQAHPDPVHSLAFSPDGNLFASAGSDTTVLIWSANAEQPKATDLSAKALDALWTDLAGADAVKAYRSIAALRAAPQQSVPFLKSHLRPVPVVDAKHIARLIADLDDERFAVRDKASAELAKLGELAEPSLRKTLEGKPSLEVRRRIQSILEGLHRALSNERLREVRAVEVLEQIGTTSAQAVLTTLAEGAASARLTREAKASLQRLAKRSASQP